MATAPLLAGITGGSEQARKLFCVAGVLDRLPLISTAEPLGDESGARATGDNGKKDASSTA